MPTSTYDDGSPRYDHGHEPVTGETWWVTTSATAEPIRRCPACGHEHPVGTTCRDCEPCRADDLTPVAEDVFADLLPGGIDAQMALLAHNRNVGLHAACDGSCGLADCRRPVLDGYGLTTYPATNTPLPRATPARDDLPVEDHYPPGAWEVD